MGENSSPIISISNFKFRIYNIGGIMKNQVLRKLFLGFIQIHILSHANDEPVFGSFMIEELKN